MMSKGKSSHVYSIINYPDDLKNFFNICVEKLEEVKILKLHISIPNEMIKIIEVGPRNGLSTTFQISTKELLNLYFETQENILSINIAAKAKVLKDVKKFIVPHVIKSVKRAMKELQPISQVI